MVRPGTTLYICPGGVISTRWILLSDVQGVKAGIFAPFIRKQYHLFNIPPVIQFIAKGGKVRLLIEPNTCFPCLTPFSSDHDHAIRSEEHTSELQSLMRISYAVFCLKNKKK